MGIRRIVHAYFQREEYPTIKKLLEVINNDPGFPNFKRESLRMFMKDLKFVFTKRSRKSILIDRKDITEWRQRYLRQIKKYRAENRDVCILYHWKETKKCQQWFLNFGTIVNFQFP